MAERDRSREERQDEDIPSLERENVDIGTGLGGGLAPVLPTDIDGHHPDREWLASSDKDTAVPNWTQSARLDPGLQRGEAVREPLRLAPDTHIVAVFGEDLGEIEEIYGYPPANDPAWAAIKDGDRKILVPLMSGQLDEDGLHVPYPKELIESAPDLPEQGLSVADEMMLYSHYNERRILPAADGETQEQERTLQVVSAA